VLIDYLTQPAHKRLSQDVIDGFKLFKTINTGVFKFAIGDEVMDIGIQYFDVEIFLLVMRNDGNNSIVPPVVEFK
jgi:hypothetical protein